VGSEIVELGDLDVAGLCRLNNEFSAETSLVNEEEMGRLVAKAFYARGVAGPDAFLIAFDERADYVNANFTFFVGRWERFVYIDRVITAGHAMRRGLARGLYEYLFLRAAAAGHTVVGCEVNLVPANPASDAFHARMEFAEVGRAELANGKTVRYLERSLDAR
jgi:predicted GNAT superfamily acetyltransferase